MFCSLCLSGHGVDQSVSRPLNLGGNKDAAASCRTQSECCSSGNRVGGREWCGKSGLCQEGRRLPGCWGPLRLRMSESVGEAHGQSQTSPGSNVGRAGNECGKAGGAGRGRAGQGGTAGGSPGATFSSSQAKSWVCELTFKGGPASSPGLPAARTTSPAQSQGAAAGARLLSPAPPETFRVFVARAAWREAGSRRERGERTGAGSWLLA